MNVPSPLERVDALDCLRREVGLGLDQLLDKLPTAYLAQFPDYDNVGDSALWLGLYKHLRSRGTEILGVADSLAYSSLDARRAVGRYDEAAVVISGGGNLGDLYPKHQANRERILRDFGSNRVIQAPQSVHFMHASSRERFLSLANAHNFFALAVRDRKSLEKLRGMTPVPALVGDTSHILNLGRHRDPIRPVLVLARRDTEVAETVPQELESIDWTRESQPNLRARLSRRMASAGFSAVAPRLRLTPSDAENIAAKRLARGLDQLTEGSVVITDRLHGVLLALGTLRPVIFLDNATGKINAYAATWNLADRGLPAYPAESWEHAVSLSNDLAQREATIW